MKDKIQALLAKAASTTHPEERDAYTRKAETLMVKWGISEAELEARDETPAALVVEQRRFDVPITGGVVLAECVAGRIARGLAPVKTFFSRGQAVWWAVGTKADLDRVALYVPSLLDQAAEAWKVFLSDRRAAGYRYETINERDNDRATFFRAFGSTVEARLAEIWAEETTSAASTAIALRTDRVEEYVAEHFASARASRKRNLGRSAALHAGHRSGAAASISAGALT